MINQDQVSLTVQCGVMWCVPSLCQSHGCQYSLVVRPIIWFVSCKTYIFIILSLISQFIVWCKIVQCHHTESCVIVAPCWGPCRWNTPCSVPLCQMRNDGGHYARCCTLWLYPDTPSPAPAASYSIPGRATHLWAQCNIISGQGYFPHWGDDDPLITDCLHKCLICPTLWEQQVRVFYFFPFLRSWG